MALLNYKNEHFADFDPMSEHATVQAKLVPLARLTVGGDVIQYDRNCTKTERNGDEHQVRRNLR